MTNEGIYPESGNRLPLPKRETLDDEGQRMYDRLVDPKGGALAGLGGPAGIRLHSPHVATGSLLLIQHFRHTAQFSPRQRELAILAVAREYDSDVEWGAHVSEARKAGIADEIIEVIRDRQSAAGLEAGDQMIVSFCRQLLGSRSVDLPTFLSARRSLGDGGLVDLVSLVGYYVATAYLIAAFDVQTPEGWSRLSET